MHAFPTSAIYAVFAMPVTSIYCNTLLANLNARAYVRGAVLPHNVDTDLFTSSSALESDTTKTAKQGGQAKIVLSAPQVGFHRPSRFNYDGLTRRRCRG